MAMHGIVLPGLVDVLAGAFASELIGEAGWEQMQSEDDCVQVSRDILVTVCLQTEVGVIPSRAVYNVDCENPA